jgi:hypothetical protein
MLAFIGAMTGAATTAFMGVMLLFELHGGVLWPIVRAREL